MLAKFTNQLPALRLATATIAALILSASLPHAAFAASADVGLWKIDTLKSKFHAGSAILTITRANGANATAGRFVVISGGGVYLMTGAAAANANGLKPVDYARMTETGEAVLIGTNPRSKDHCGFKCRAGLPEHTRTVIFTVVNGKGQKIQDMLAYDDQNW
jgi:hypothetical protein